MRGEEGYFKKSKDRDSVILMLFAVMVAYLFYMWYVNSQMKSTLDNRPHGFQSLRDDTGATNSQTPLRYGVTMPLTPGMKTNSGNAFSYANGVSQLSIGGKVQGEYGNQMPMGKSGYTSKSPMDVKSKLTPKTTDTYLSHVLGQAQWAV